MSRLRLQLALSTGVTPASFKFDGKRFVNTDTTLKLVKDASYDFTITSSIPIVVQEGSAQLRVYLEVETEPEKLNLLDSSRDAERTVLKGTWAARLPVSKNNTRVYMWLDLTIEGFGKVSMPLCVKVYTPGDKSVRHGFTLRYVQYEYRQDTAHPGRTELSSTNFFRV